MAARADRRSGSIRVKAWPGCLTLFVCQADEMGRFNGVAGVRCVISGQAAFWAW